MVHGTGLVLGVSEFVDYLNQTLEVAYPFLEIEGELANLRVSKNKWVYFDIKDDTASVRCFGTVYSLPGPLEDGMLVRIAGSPRLHPLYNFSFNVQSITPVGEGALRKAADLLAAKLEAEGLFDTSRKRPLPYPPQRIALITAGDSAAYADFMKIAAARWGGVRIEHYDVQVQGEPAPGQIMAALAAVNGATDPVDTAVLIRGGGSADDLASFSDERVVRAVAASRVPTLVAIGHEIDVSLAELAADMRASTPSNAAELLFPDKKEELRRLKHLNDVLDDTLRGFVTERRGTLERLLRQLDDELVELVEHVRRRITTNAQLLQAYDPARPLAQGYALVRSGGQVVTGVNALEAGSIAELQFADGTADTEVKRIHKEHPHGKK